MVVDFREVMLTSPPEIAHFWGKGGVKGGCFFPPGGTRLLTERKEKIDENWIYSFP